MKRGPALYSLFGDRGFRSAWRTVLAADTVSLLAAVLLYIIAVETSRASPSFSDFLR